MFSKGVQGRFWRVLRNLYSGFRGRVKPDSAGALTNPFRIDTGPTLFNIFFDDLVSQLKQKFAGAQFSFGTHLPVLAYADDLVLISNSAPEMQKMLDFCYSYARENEFEFNSTKCKILKMHKKSSAALKLGPDILEVVAHYKYLGVPLGRGMHESSRPSPFGRYYDRIHAKATARSMVTRFLGAKGDGLRPKTGLKLYCMLVRPILEYASPVIIFNKTNMKKLEQLQLKILKQTVGL